MFKLPRGTKDFSPGEMHKRRYVEEAIFSVFKTFYGLKHPYVGLALAAIADLLERMNNLLSAKEYFKLTLEICKIIYKPDHPNYMRTKTRYESLKKELKGQKVNKNRDEWLVKMWD